MNYLLFYRGLEATTDYAWPDFNTIGLSRSSHF
jgi:hypothetical protein